MTTLDTSAGAVVLSRLSKSYGDVQAVRSIELTIAPGETVALLGPNGAGKTTTIDMVARRLPERPRARDDGRVAVPRPLEADDALMLSGCSGFADRRTTKLSGGQAQHVRFALALAADPDLPLLDEPTAALDVEARRDFWTPM